jgi:dTDP-4-dehydrorhamnose reductase
LKKKILIFGGTGLLGSNIYEFFNKKYNFFFNFHRSKIRFKKKIIYRKIIVRKKINVKEIIKINPDIIINCIANTNLEYCENNPKSTNYPNVIIPTLLSKICFEKNIKFVHISSDHLYSTNLKFKTEKTKTNPINVYARQKLAAEKIILSNNNKSLILRTNFFGHFAKRDKSIYGLIDNLVNKKKTILDNKYFFTPIYTYNLIKILDKLISKNISGIFNIVGNNRISKFDFALLITKIIGIKNPKLINELIENNKKLKAKRCKDLSLSNNKIKNKIKISIPQLDQQLKLFFKNEIIYQKNLEF